MSATPDKYRAPFCTQRGIDSTLDDCAVVATIHCLAYATLGEYVTTASGREMGKAQLHALARRMRRSLGPSEASGGLSIANRQEMCVRAGFPAPASIDIAFADMKAGLSGRRFVYSVSGNPARIKGPSPIKRTAVAHEFAIVDIRKGGAEMLVYDGMRPAGPRNRGEWRPSSEVRQFAFKSDGKLDFVLAYPIGGYTEAALIAKRKNKTIRAVREEQQETANQLRTMTERRDRIRDQRDALKDEVAELKAQIEDPTEAVQAAREQLLDSLHDWEAEQRAA